MTPTDKHKKIEAPHTQAAFINALASEGTRNLLREGGRVMGKLEELDKAATQGVWGRFSIRNGPFQPQAEHLLQSNRKVYWDVHDTTHEMSALAEDGPKRLANFTHADDAAFAEALVNAYRSGELVPTGKE